MPVSPARARYCIHTHIMHQTKATGDNGPEERPTAWLSADTRAEDAPSQARLPQLLSLTENTCRGMQGHSAFALKVACCHSRRLYCMRRVSNRRKKVEAAPSAQLLRASCREISNFRRDWMLKNAGKRRLVEASACASHPADLSQVASESGRAALHTPLKRPRLDALAGQKASFTRGAHQAYSMCYRRHSKHCSGP